MAESEASSLTLASTRGGSTLELKARALPYRPLTIGGRQRMEFTWYPGSPSATVQMLGPEEAPIVMNGFWKDRFISEQPQDSSAGHPAVTYNGETITRVTDLVDIVDAMRRSGLTYRFSWDRLQRFGHIANFEVTWHNTHDAEWVLEFAVTAQEERAAVTPAANKAANQRLATALNAQSSALAERTASIVPQGVEGEGPAARSVLPQNVGVLQDFLARLETLEDQMTALTNDALRVANLVTTSIMAFPNAARSLVATTTRSLTQVSNTITSITDQAVGTYFYFVGGQDESAIGSQVAATNAQQELASWWNGMRATTVFGRYDVQQQLQQEQTQAYLATADMDFRDISTQFYGTPDSWIALMQYNGYTDSKVSAGELIWVPAQPSSGALGSGGDY